LPALVARLNKPSGSPIVLGIVTHSHFMKAGIGAKCSRFWEERGSPEKPLNNQVLDMTYTFTQYSVGGADVTPYYTLKPVHPICSEVTGDEPMKNTPSAHSGKLCLRDVGDPCMNFTLTYALASDKLIGKTFEKEILQISQEIVAGAQRMTDLDASFKSLVESKAALEEILKQHGGQIKCTAGTSTDCAPSDYCYRRKETCQVKEDYSTEKLAKLATQLEQAQQRLIEEVGLDGRLKQKLEELKKTTCWTGGRPEPLMLPNLQANTLVNRLIDASWAGAQAGASLLS